MTNDEPGSRNTRAGSCVAHPCVTPLASGGHQLSFFGPVGAANQVLLSDARYLVVHERALGTQVLTATHPEPAPAIHQLLDLLRSVLTLPTRDGVDFAVALDWYKTPVDGVRGERWNDTKTGALVHRTKYPSEYPDSERLTTEDGAELLADQMHSVAQRHHLFRSVDAVTAPPGHDPKRLTRSFGAVLARAMARRLETRLVFCHGSGQFRTSAKDLAPAQRIAKIGGTFSCTASLQGKSVLIVDDVYQSGVTMAETARALRLAGARQVAGLCPVRTVR